MAEVLNEDQIEARMKSVPTWELQDNAIEQVFEFEDFAESIQFVNDVAEIAEEEAHHPDIDIRWNKVKLVLSTHSAGGLTASDFALAQRIDSLLD